MLRVEVLADGVVCYYDDVIPETTVKVRPINNERAKYTIDVLAKRGLSVSDALRLARVLEEASRMVHILNEGMA